MVIHFFLIYLIYKTFNKIERPEIQTKKLNLISVQNKMELTTLNNFLKSKKDNFILYFYYIIDNSLDQKKLNEYNISLPSNIPRQPEGADSPSKTGEKCKGKNKSIEEEINFLIRLSMQIQEKNEKYKNIIEDKVKHKVGYQTIDEGYDYNFNEDNKTGNSKASIDSLNTKNFNKLDKILLVLKNSAYHIYKLQLAQFADSIKSIYKNTKNNEFCIIFDNTDEEIPSIILNEKDYTNLISIRDKYENNDILSSFISKENCINPNSVNNQKKYKSLTPNKFYNQPTIIKQNKIKDEANTNSCKNIGNFILSSYHICHQCKLKKIEEDLIRCQYIHIIPNEQTQNNNENNSHNNSNTSNQNNESPINYFFIGQSALILTNKVYYLKNYDDNVKELVESYFVPKLRGNTRKCEKYYCKNCLRNIYDIDVTEIKKKNFQCPSCSNRCICSRCIRYENLIKQIAYYLNNFGDIDKLYDYLVKQNSIFEKLKDNLIIRKFICVDFSAKNYPTLKLNTSANSVGKKGTNGMGNNFLDLLKYKKHLENLQFDFCDIYDEANLKQQLYDAEFLKIKESNFNNNSVKEGEKNDKKNQKLIGRKLKNPNIRKK